MGTSGNIKRLKQSLLAREIIDIYADQIDLQEPVYKYWLKKEYFRILGKQKKKAKYMQIGYSGDADPPCPVMLTPHKDYGSENLND